MATRASFFAAGACLLAALAAFSCRDDDPFAPPVPGPIRAFVEAQRLPLLRDIRVDLSVTDHRLTFFHARYGQPHDCPSGCFYSSAFGVQFGDKVGWIHVYDLEGIVIQQLTYYNLESSDVLLFDEATWAKLQAGAEWIFWSAFLPYLAADEDSPHEALVRIARRLDEYISPQLALQLLANSRIHLYADVLQIIACLPELSDDLYEQARSAARAMLGGSFPGCDGEQRPFKPGDPESPA